MAGTCFSWNDRAGVRSPIYLINYDFQIPFEYLHLDITQVLKNQKKKFFSSSFTLHTPKPVVLSLPPIPGNSMMTQHPQELQGSSQFPPSFLILFPPLSVLCFDHIYAQQPHIVRNTEAVKVGSVPYCVKRDHTPWGQQGVSTREWVCCKIWAWVG